MKYVIGVDLGTSGVKTLLLREDGAVIGTTSATYTPDFGAKGKSEQEPIVWWENTKNTVCRLIEENNVKHDEVVSIAVSGQMHGSVFLDENGNVVRPAILWNDTRTTKQVNEIFDLVGGKKELLSQVYNTSLEGFTLPKILWLKENEPENFAKVHKVILPKDYINFMLTGEIKTDYSDAAGTILFDVKKAEWNKKTLAAVGLDETIMAEAVESTAVIGKILPKIAKELGLGEDVLIAAGGADNSCAAIGNGVVSKGQAVISVGTSGTVVAFLDGINAEVTGDVHLFNYSYPKSYYAMGVMLSAGECKNWLHRSIFAGKSFEEIDAFAAKSTAGSNGVIFLPYLFGERCPFSDPYAKGAFFGLNGITTEGDVSRAVMEGVAFGLRDVFELVSAFTEMEEIYITGGGAKSKIFGEIISSVVNRSLRVLSVEQGPSVGAAFIAGVGTGVFKDFEDAKNKTMKVARTIEPNAADNAVYEKIYPLYKELYKNNKETFAKLAKL